MCKEAFPAVSEQDFAYGWLVVNTRTFLLETPETMLYPYDDRLALLPLADLFNHADCGCKVTFSTESYVFTADRTYEEGEEVYISYGEHSNDFLLTEYGFMLQPNRWDQVGLDEVVLPKLTAAQRMRLDQVGLLGDYTLDSESKPSERTAKALRVLCGDSANGINGLSDSVNGTDHSRDTAGMLKSTIDELKASAKRHLEQARSLQVGEKAQRDLLIQRWEQIEAMLDG